MSNHGNDAVTRTQEEAAARSRARGLETGWTVFSYLLAGMAAYGIIGWLIGRAVHVPLLFPVGMLVGLGISIGYIIYRYGAKASLVHRPGQPAGKGPAGDR
jgi:F0F1-type ATP synthase assembly protein I